MPTTFLFLPTPPAGWAERVRADFPEVDVVVAPDEAAALRAAPGVDAMYGTPSPAFVAAAKKLRWIQAPMLGMEHFLTPELAASPVVITSVGNIYADYLADHLIAFVLTIARDLHTAIRNQVQGRWRASDPTRVPALIQLAGQTLGLIGFGASGRLAGKRARAFDMDVIAVDARPNPADDPAIQVWPTERLDDLLRASDFVGITAPQTPKTVGLIGERELGLMKPSAYLMNVSRGKIVRLDPLARALQRGQIAGAALDVFETEPLPASSPLWQMPNVIITPHYAGSGPLTEERRRDVLLNNLRRFLNGEPLQNVVDKQGGF